MDQASYRREWTAFVLNGDVSGLGVIRSLGREGIPLRVMDYKPTPGLYSRYGKGVLAPHPQDEAEKALRALMAEGEKVNGKGLLFPASDQWVQFVSTFRQELSAGFEMVLPSQEISEGLTNKRFQHEEAVKAGVPIARTFYPRNAADVDDIKGELEYPVFIKPYSGHLWRVHFPNKGFEAGSSQELVSHFERILPLGLDAMVQEIVVGPNTNHFEVSAYVSRKGELRDVFVAQKMRQYPSDYGMGTLLRSVHNEEVARLGQRLLTEMGHRGIADVEFKRDERDGRYKMLDINSRYWYQTMQATRAGINFPLVQYLDLSGQDLPPVRDYADGVTWLNAPSNVLSIYNTRTFIRSKWGDAIRGWLDADSYAYFALDDPGPALRRVVSRSLFENLLFMLPGQKAK